MVYFIDSHYSLLCVRGTSEHMLWSIYARARITICFAHVLSLTFLHSNILHAFSYTAFLWNIYYAGYLGFSYQTHFYNLLWAYCFKRRKKSFQKNVSLLRHESVQAHFATFGELLHIHQLEFCVISQHFIEIVKKFRHTVQMVLKQWDICRNNRRAWKATQNGVFDQILITSSCFRTQQSRWFWWNYWETEISTWYLIFVRETVHDRSKTVISSIYRL